METENEHQGMKGSRAYEEYHKLEQRQQSVVQASVLHA